MKNYENLGSIQIAILKELADEQTERSTIFDLIRNRLYKRETPKCISRQSIRRAIKSLKQRNLIVEQVGIIGLNN